MEMAPSDSTPPSPGGPYSHQQRPSTASTTMHRPKRSLARFDGATSRLSDEESRTAVKVAVRVRPPMKGTDPGFDLIPQRFRESTCDTPSPTSLSVQSPQGKRLFVFDRVFDGETTQEGIWDYLSDSVTSFVNGYNVSILAYGQSGSGKSYTMGTSGPEDQSDARIMGIVPRAAQALFEKLNGAPPRQSGLQAPKRYSTQGLPTLSSITRALNGTSDGSWSLKATYVEIYQEQLRDLLVPESVPQADRAQVAIREDTRGRILVTGLTQVDITSVEDLLSALNFGSSIRQTDATNINARSSRSHAVFSLNLVQKKADATVTPRREKRRSMPVEPLSSAESTITLDSKLHFVDLAGSERLKNTGATGDRAKEGISINAGLASLGKVISQLSSKQAGAHISYRDSRLTRLLQDSLGGNAITFMVACVTPAVFHLSETLNTVHYAQRARAIQSKPEIQQSYEEGDKQAAIDRLRAEVSFLRDQIRHSEHADGKSENVRGRTERLRSKELELQQQLLDTQENYNALSQRHAKLIAELSKARGDEHADMPDVREEFADTAVERIKRSSSFADAVEQMILEYEKTITALESSLSNARSSLSVSENTLLEKETTLSYVEAARQKLHARVQKAREREQSSETYLRDLEARIEGTTSGEERNAALITELNRELARVRESENSAEDYISTLEERLVEAEQDQDIMQRELDRLEHVIERQRSVGRLDNLLGELDGLRQQSPAMPHLATLQQHGQQHSQLKSAEQPRVNGHRESYDPFKPESDIAPSESEYSQDEDDFVEVEPVRQEVITPTATGRAITTTNDLAQAHAATQNDFMFDKIENMTQELFDLRSEHENTLNDMDKLQQKYQTALETLAKLEYSKGGAANGALGSSRSTSFLANAGMRGEEVAEDRQPSSSRLLSEELSSQQYSNSSLEELTKMAERDGPDTTADPATHEDTDAAAQVPLPPDDVQPELEMLRRLHAEKEGNVIELTRNYEALHERHEEVLAQVDELKQEVQRAQNLPPPSPGFGKTFLRRKSDGLMGGFNDDRASRSLNSLKNIASDNFEHNSDIRQSFELNLNAVMNELHGRTERMLTIEAELANAKKEMEAKQTIISGLTRERTSLSNNASVDFSVVGQMREQLLESENQIRTLHEQHGTREKEFLEQIENLKAALASHQNQLPTPRDDHFSHMPGEFPDTISEEEREAVDGTSVLDKDEQISRLRREIDDWEMKHTATIVAMKTSEAKLLETISDLEDSMMHTPPYQTSSVSPPFQSPQSIAAAKSMEAERSAHREIVSTLQREVEQYKSAANGHLAKLNQLETSYTGIAQRVNQDSSSRDLSSEELETHKDLVASLENQLQVHKAAITSHKESLDSLQASHAEEMEDLKASMITAERTSTARHAELEQHHERTKLELKNSQKEKADILRSASSALGYETDGSKLHSQIKGLVEEGKELHLRHVKATNDINSVQEELQNAMSHAVELENRVAELKAINEESVATLAKMTDREQKSSRLVEELEEQLNNNFDSHRATNNRLSTIQGEVAQQRMELERELEDQKMRNVLLEQQIVALQRQSVQSSSSVNFNRESLSPEAAAIALARSGSSSSQAQKTNGTAVLPTPPPSIPLPPLPNSPTTSTPPPIQNGIDMRATSPIPRAMSSSHNVSPPTSRHASKDLNSGMSQQQVEEQEARIRTIEKHLFAEKQLTATLEEALVDLETSANRTKSEMETYRKKCVGLEDELENLRKERNVSRASIQAVEEERERRVRAEHARQALELRMNELSTSKKKKKNALNCF